MQCDAMKLYNSIDFLDAVKVLYTTRSKAKLTLLDRQINRKKPVRRISKEFAMGRLNIL